MANHSTWARHREKRCKKKCWYCEHPPVFSKPAWKLSPHQYLQGRAYSRKQLKSLAMQFYKNWVEGKPVPRDPGTLIQPVTDPAIIHRVSP